MINGESDLEEWPFEVCEENVGIRWAERHEYALRYRNVDRNNQVTGVAGRPDGVLASSFEREL